jgi:hypothetical protein
MVCDGEKLSSVLDSAPQKSIDSTKISKKVFNNCKNAGLCNLISDQESPVPLPKFQMAPRLKNLNVLWVQERNPDILSFSL